MTDDQMGQDEIEELLRKAQSGNLEQKPEANAEPTEQQSLDQSEIEALFGSGSADTSKAQPSVQAKPAAETKTTAPAAQSASSQSVPPDPPSDLEFLLNQAEEALASLNSPNENLPAGIAPFQLRDFGGSPPNSEKATIDLVRDVELEVKIELGQANMHLEEVLQMKKGAVVPLDKLAGDPVDVYVNGRLIARGEVLILNDNFCVRLTELVVGDTVA